MQFTLRKLMMAVAAVAIVIAIWSQRGRVLTYVLKHGPDKVWAWESLVALNNTEALAKPSGVWWDQGSGVGWVQTGGTIIAVSPRGEFGDGGMICRGSLRALWTGTTPNGHPGIVLISEKGVDDWDDHLMFLTYDSGYRVRLLVEINTPDYESEFELDDGWPCVDLINAESKQRERFTLHEDPSRQVLRGKGRPKPWQVKVGR